MVLLSICIPVGRDWEVVQPWISELKQEIGDSEMRHQVEICISLNDLGQAKPHSEPKTEFLKIRELTGPSSFGENLWSSIQMAQGKWVLLMGDDDKFLSSDLSNLLAEISRLDDRGCLVLPLMESPRVEKGYLDRVQLAMRAGSMMGLLIANDERLREAQKLWSERLPPMESVYPQVFWSLFVSRSRTPILDSPEVSVGHQTEENPFLDNMSRPSDFGIRERLLQVNILQGLSRLTYLDSLRLRANFGFWFGSTSRYLEATYGRGLQGSDLYANASMQLRPMNKLILRVAFFLGRRRVGIRRT